MGFDLLRVLTTILVKTSKQDIICRGLKDVNLQIKCDVAKGAGDITSQTERLIHGTISTLHVQDYTSRKCQGS